jgi:hypothetical protein
MIHVDPDACATTLEKRDSNLDEILVLSMLHESSQALLANR